MKNTFLSVTCVTLIVSPKVLWRKKRRRKVEGMRRETEDIYIVFVVQVESARSSYVFSRKHFSFVLNLLRLWTSKSLASLLMTMKRREREKKGPEVKWSQWSASWMGFTQSSCLFSQKFSSLIFVNIEVLSFRVLLSLHSLLFSGLSFHLFLTKGWRTWDGLFFSS